MKCKKCDGYGYYHIYGYFDDMLCSIVKHKCELCNGTGEMPITNEEWFDTLSTKEKAEWLDKVAENCCQICDKENRESCRRNIAIGCKFENAKMWERWLKQPHTERD